MSNEQVSINAHEILLNNQNDERDSHIVIRTTKTLGENDIELRTCNVKIKDGAMQTNKIVPFSGSNIDLDNNTLINATLGSGTSIPSGLINASDVGSDNYSGQTLDYELDTLQSNINAKLSTTGNTGNKFLTTTGAGTIQFSKNISDIVDLNTVQTITNKSIDATNNTVTNIPYANLTGTPTIPSNNNELTNGAGYITADSTDTLTNKSISYSQITNQPTIPSNNNELTNGAGYITADSTDTLTNKSISYTQLTGTPSIPTNNSQLINGEGYITADSTDTLTNKSISYTQLTGTPSIPTNNSQLINGEGYITASSTDTLTNKSMSYSQLTGTPTIPSNNNELTNGAGYITADSTDTLTNKSISYSQITNQPTIPTNNNELTNGAGYITPSSTDTLTNKTITSGVLTTPQINDTSLDNKYIIGVSELSDDRTITLPLLTGNDTFTFKNHTQTLTNKTMSGSSNTFSNIPYSALTGTPTIPSNNNELTNGAGYITASSTDTLTNKSMSYSQLTGTPTIPTNNNQLTNGANYMTPSSSASMTNKTMSVDNNSFNDFQTTSGTSYTFESGVNTSDEYKFRKNLNNTRTDIFTVNYTGTPIVTFENTPKIGSDNILHANDNISQLNNNSGYITASSTDTLTNKSISYSQLTGTPTIPTNNNELTNGAGYITASSTDTLTNKSMSYSQLTGTPTIPTNNNQLTNGASYITASSTDTLTNKTIDFNNNTILNATGGVQASDNTTFTGNNKFQGEVEIDEDNGGNLEFLLTNGALPPQVCTTNLVSVQHQNTSATTFTLSLPAIKTGQTTDQLVGKDAIQTLTGKTIDFNNNTILNATGGITADSTDTLTNKTIDGTNNTITNIPYANLTGTPTIPTNNNELTNGAGYITASSSDILTNKQYREIEIIPDGLGTKITQTYTQDINSGYPDYRFEVEVGVFQFIRTDGTGDDVMFFCDNATKDFHIHSSNTFEFKQTGELGVGLLRTVGWSNSFKPQERIHIFRQESGNTFDRLMLLEKHTTDDFSEDRNGSGGYIEFITRNQGTNYYGSARVGCVYDGEDNDEGSSALVFWTSDNTGTSFGSGDTLGYDSNNEQAERMRINHDGNVGIGTDNPTFKLDVVGTLRTTGASALGATSNTSTTLDVRGSGSSDTVHIYSDHSSQDFRWRFRYDEFSVQRETSSGNETYGSTDMYLNYNSGDVIVDGTAVSSDNRIKHNEEVVTNGIDIIRQLTPKRYFKTTKVYGENHNYDLDSSGNPITEDYYKIETGLIAQEILQIPEINHLVKLIPDKSRIERRPNGEEVTIEAGERYTLNYQDIFVYNVEATKQLINKVETLEALVASLTSRLEALEN